jgi:hypothetical protein
MSITQLDDGNPDTCRMVLQHFPAFYLMVNRLLIFILVSFLS